MTLDLPHRWRTNGNRGGISPRFHSLSLTAQEEKKTVRQGSTGGEKKKEEEVLSSVCYLAACSCRRVEQTDRRGKRIKGTEFDMLTFETRARARALAPLPLSLVCVLNGPVSPVRYWRPTPRWAHSSFHMAIKSYKLLSLVVQRTQVIYFPARVFNTNQTRMDTQHIPCTIYFFFSPPFCIVA